MPKRQRSGAYKKSGVTINLGAPAKGKRKYRRNSKYPASQYGHMYVPVGQETASVGTSWRNATDAQRQFRRDKNFYGRGGFFGDVWKGVKRVAKDTYGDGSAISGALRGKVMKGLGSYETGVDDNDLIHGGHNESMTIAQVNPSMTDDSGDVVMSHSEFIGNVVASAQIPAASGTNIGASTTVQSQFQNQVYPINPGLQGSFPFLCQLAQNYTMYKLEGLIYQYKPTSGEGGGSSNQLGKVIMATDYDPMAEEFINSVQMENYQYSNSTKPSLAARHGVETATAQGITEMKYIRTGKSSRDKAFTDYGMFQFATEGIPITTDKEAVAKTVTANIGELWVSYKIRLSRANLFSSLLGYNIRGDSYSLTAQANASASSPVIFTSYIGAESNNIGTTIKARTGTTNVPDSLTIIFPPSQILGVYKITIMASYLSADPASNVLAWIPMTDPANQNIDDYTQWGCPFLPMANIYDAPKTIPKVNMVSGLPDVPSNLASQAYKLCSFTTEVTDAASPHNTTTTIYYSINSPSTTVPRLNLGLAAFASGTTPPQYNSFATLSYQQVASFRLSIEQVNSQITA